MRPTAPIAAAENPAAIPSGIPHRLPATRLSDVGQWPGHAMIAGRPLETGRMGNSKIHVCSVGPEEMDAISTPGADVPHVATAGRVKDNRAVSRSNLA